VASVAVWFVDGERLGDAERPVPSASLGPSLPPAAPAPATGNEPDRARAQKREARRDDRLAARFALQPEPANLPVDHEFGDPPRAGVMFDVASGEILWEHHPDRELPIASLTKMMTAYLIATRHRPDEEVPISKEAVQTGGSMIGVLPEGEKVPLGGLLKGLLLVSGNDAATALAEHDAGSVDRFVERMNDEAKALGLHCSHFTSPHGLVDEGNHSCPRDLAILARADLSSARIAKIAATDHDRVRFPIKGGVLELYNNNPFIRAGDPTITGLKTGYTDAAGRCYVTTAERGGREIGVVLLDSPNPLEQVPKLLELGAGAQ
jgi:D-alanyl-D-alanine carboxypeptidase